MRYYNPYRGKECEEERYKKKEWWEEEDEEGEKWGEERKEWDVQCGGREKSIDKERTDVEGQVH